MGIRKTTITQSLSEIIPLALQCGEDNGPDHELHESCNPTAGVTLGLSATFSMKSQIESCWSAL
jgi:hypothetical protein